MTAKTTATRPSELVGIIDRWAALQFDNAVIFVGTVLDNASQEQTNRGSDKDPKWGPRYTMDQLLDPAFRLPAPLTEKQREQAAIEKLIGMAGGAVKLFKL